MGQSARRQKEATVELLVVWLEPSEEGDAGALDAAGMLTFRGRPPQEKLFEKQQVLRSHQVPRGEEALALMKMFAGLSRRAP